MQHNKEKPPFDYLSGVTKNSTNLSVVTKNAARACSAEHYFCSAQKRYACQSERGCTLEENTSTAWLCILPEFT